jgi:hypothetical protein
VGSDEAASARRATGGFQLEGKRHGELIVRHDLFTRPFRCTS